MAIKVWWDGDPTQRYWMEVATTGAMGEILIAPKFAGATWSYELVRHVRTGDRILHWRSESGTRGFVGWSVVTAEPQVAPEYVWQPRGTAGRALSGPRTTEAWMVTLGGLNLLANPPTSDQLQTLAGPVLEVAAKLESVHGKPIYFPFYRYGELALRAQQGYLVKFPVELLDILPKIEAARLVVNDDPAGEVEEDGQPSGWRVPRGRLPRVLDPELRSAIENHAVDRAIEHYRRVGGSDFVKLGKPYDIRLTLDGQERHVEVKGSSLAIETVELTINEVVHAADFQPTDLIVVDDIRWERTSNGKITTTGGRLRIWTDWRPTDDALSARRFAYLLPSDE